MLSRKAKTVTFEAEKVIQPIYTGGDISADSHGRILATCLGDQVALTDLKDGHLLARIDGDGEAITSLTLTPDARHLIICSRSTSMSIFSLEISESRVEPNSIRVLKPFPTPVVSLSVDESSTILATGTTDGSIKVWDIRGGYITHHFRGHSSVISALKLFQLTPKSQSPQAPGIQGSLAVDAKRTLPEKNGYGYRLACGSEDGKLRIWDLFRKKSSATLSSHASTISSIDFSQAQHEIVTGSRDKTIIIWDCQTWKPRKTLAALESIESTGFVDGGRIIFSGGETGRLRLWDTNSGHELTREQPLERSSNPFVAVHHPPLSLIILAVRADQMLEIRDLQAIENRSLGEQIFAPPIWQRISGTHDEVIDFGFVSGEHDLLALATNTEYLKLISLSEGSPAEIESGRNHYFGADVALLEGHDDIIICLDVDWSGQWIATGAKDNTARLWHVDRANEIFRCVAVFVGHAGSLGALALPQMKPPHDSAAFKNPGQHYPKFLITGSQDQTIKRWKIALDSYEHEPAYGRAEYTRKAHEKDINALEISDDSLIFASASQDRLVKIWSSEDGEVQGILRGHKRGVWSIKFGPKKLPVIAGDGSTSTSTRGVILTGSGDRSVKIWSLADYSCLRTLEGHTNSVLKVVWFHSRDVSERSPTTTMAASAGGDGLVKVWDVQSGECVSTLDNHTERVWALGVSPDDKYLVSGGGDGVVTFWADTTIMTMENKAAESTARIEQEQELENHIRHGLYHDAIVLALRLNHPARLLALFTEVVKRYPREPGSLSGAKEVDNVIEGLDDDDLFTLLLRIRDWNAVAKTSHVAQRMLWVVIKLFPGSRLARLKKRGQDLNGIVDGLKAYTERHYKRVEDLLEESFLVDFLVWNMSEEGFVDGDPWKVNGVAGLMSGEMTLG